MLCLEKSGFSPQKGQFEMKKRSTKALAALMALFCVFALASCDEDAINEFFANGGSVDIQINGGNGNNGNGDHQGNGNTNNGNGNPGNNGNGDHQGNGNTNNGNGNPGNNGNGNGNKPTEPEITKTPAELYADWTSYLKNDSNRKVVINNNQSTEVNGEEVTSCRTLTFENEGQKQYLFAKLDSPEEPIAEKYWYVDGVLYSQIGENNKKRNLEYSQFVEQYGIEVILSQSYVIDASLANVPAEWLKDLSIEKNEDGDLCINFSVNKEQYLEHFGYGMFAMLFNQREKDFDIHYEIKLGEDGAVRCVSLFASIDMEEYTTDIVMSVELSDIGKITVNLPFGARDWVDEDIEPEDPPEDDDPPTEDPPTIDPPTDDNPSYVIKWDKTEIKMELTKNSSHGELSSGCERYYAGTKVDAFDDIDSEVRSRNLMAANAANVYVNLSYVGEVSEFGWGANINRIAISALSTDSSSPDIYCNFAYDMTCAQLRGCFANLKDTSYTNGNWFRFNDDDYATDIASENYFDDEAGEGYFYEYMESLSLSDDKMYILASNYTIDVIRAMMVVPVNLTMLNEIQAEDSWTGDMQYYVDFYDLVWRDENKIAYNEKYAEGFTYDVLAHYSRKVYTAHNTGYNLDDTVGFIAARSSGLASSALLYSSGVNIIDRTPNGDGSYTYTYPETNTDLNTYVQAVTDLFRNNAEKGIITVTASEAREYNSIYYTDLAFVRDKFAKNEVLFGGITLLASLEDTVYQNMRLDGRDGFGIAPVPVYSKEAEYSTQVHNLAKVVAIGKGSTKFSQCSIYLDYLSRSSAEVVDCYYEDVIGGGVGGVPLTINRVMLRYIRNHVRDNFDKTMEDLVSYKYSIEVGDVTAIESKWHEILGNKYGFIYPSFVTDYAEYIRIKQKNLDKIAIEWENNCE